MADKRQFGRWLDITMRNRGTKGRDLADAIGVHESMISRWRSGAAVPSMDAIFRIAEQFGVDGMRLAVTAGAIKAKHAHVAPLPVPQDENLRERVKMQISSIRGLTPELRQAMLETFDAKRQGGMQDA